MYNKQKNFLSLEELKKKELNELRETELALEELELQKKEKWADVKDFIPVNSWEKMETFKLWNKNVYTVQSKTLKAKITKIKNRHGIID